MLNQFEFEPKLTFLATSLDVNQKCLIISEKHNMVASPQGGPDDSHLHALL